MENPKLTAIVLNWKRPQNVQRICEAYPSWVDIIVWDNNPKDKPKLPARALYIVASRDAGLYSRFAAACLARTPAVLIQDDDVLIPVDTLSVLYGLWERQRDILHGVFGRNVNGDGGYASCVDRRNAEVAVALTRVLVARREIFGEFFKVLSIFDEVQKDAQPHGNGEDIILSYVSRKLSGKMNRVHQLETKELPAGNAIHARKNHFPHRDKLMRKCEAWL